MKTQGSYSVTNTGISALKIEYVKQVCKEIGLATGWNIVSVPLSASDMSAVTLFPSATSPVFGYANGYVSTSTLGTGRGYWLRYPQAAVSSVCGEQPASAPAVIPGWNLVGVYDRDIPVSGITTTPAGILTSQFFGYNSGYTVPVTLLSGKGYWVRASSAGIINLNAAAKTGSNTIISENWKTVTVADAAGNSQTLYLTEHGNNGADFDLPPVPPSGIFDARFASQKMVSGFGEANDLVIKDAAYPITITTTAASLTVKDNATGGKIINERVSNGGRLIISNTGIVSLNLLPVQIPAEYILEQNYPNPFNPSTVIRYTVPKQSRISLRVYDILGRVVADLVNEMKEPGAYSVDFNASKLASGIYIYTLQADNVNFARKMMFMK
jgi:hypothetical protein